MPSTSSGLLTRLNLILKPTERVELLALIDSQTATTPSKRLRDQWLVALAEELANDELMAILAGNEANVSVRLRRALIIAFADEPIAEEFIALLEAIDVTTVAPTTAAPTTAAPTTAAPTTAAPTTAAPTTAAPTTGS